MGARPRPSGRLAPAEIRGRVQPDAGVDQRVRVRAGPPPRRRRYASAGQAGASGYLAAMAVVGLAPDVMKPTALVLNVLVATIAAVRFHRAGRFSWPTF